MAASSIKGATETVKEARQEIQGSGSEGFSVGWIIVGTVGAFNDLIDYAGLVLNVTGIWEVIIFAINLINLSLIIFWKIAKGDLKSLAKPKVVLSLIVEHIPVVGDLWPGWIVSMVFLRKKSK